MPLTDQEYYLPLVRQQVMQATEAVHGAEKYVLRAHLDAPRHQALMRRLIKLSAALHVLDDTVCDFMQGIAEETQ